MFVTDEDDLKGTSPDEEEEEDAPQASPSESDTSEESEDDDSEDTTDWKAEAAKQKQIAENQRIRAEKAEGKKKKAPAQQETSTDGQPTYTLKDTLALQNNKVHEDDVDDVVKYAKLYNMSISDALKSDIIKTTLAKRNEERTTAETTNTNRNRGGRAARTGESILKNAQTKGEIPENADELDKMIDARIEHMSKNN